MNMLIGKNKLKIINKVVVEDNKIKKTTIIICTTTTTRKKIQRVHPINS